MGTTTKRDLIERVADATKFKRNDVRSIVHEFLEQLARELEAGRRIEFRDFGVFEVRTRSRRAAQNPKTLTPVEVPARRNVKFKAGRSLRDRIDRATELGVSGAGASRAAESDAEVGELTADEFTMMSRELPRVEIPPSTRRPSRGGRAGGGRSRRVPARGASNERHLDPRELDGRQADQGQLDGPPVDSRPNDARLVDGSQANAPALDGPDVLSPVVRPSHAPTPSERE
ncbi:MAG: HU family DNA-binding protein [Planctomycetota bacterium]|nr:HU family DNA-binding protein [Planctomycetota bacterium]